MFSRLAHLTRLLCVTPTSTVVSASLALTTSAIIYTSATKSGLLDEQYLRSLLANSFQSFTSYADESSNQVYGWGNNLYGQLGHGRAMSDALPRPIFALDGKSVVSIQADAESVLAITSDGSVYTWGQEEEYCLGTGRNTSTHVPTRLDLPPVITAAISPTHGCAVDKNGNLWVWGTRAIGAGVALQHGQAVQPTASSGEYRGLFTRSTADPRRAGTIAVEKVIKTPVMLDSTLWDGVPVTAVSCGLNHTIFTLADGRVFGMGSNYEGALGLGDDFDPVAASEDAVAKLAQKAGFAHAMTNQTGRGGERRRGSSLRQPIDYPVQIPALSGKGIKKITCGKRHTLALTESGCIFSFGEDSYGQLGQSSMRDSSRYLRTPKLIRDSLEGVRVVDIATGDSHAAAVTSNGRVYVWGLGSDGQIGNGTTEFKNYSPVLNHHLELAGVRAISVACGGGHTVVLDDKGKLWAFGRGRDGQLGRGAHLESIAAGRSLPVCVDFVKEGLVQKPFNPAETKVIDVALGTNSSFALVQRD